MTKYKCLILDHDDTVVSTTAEIHFPSFQKTISELKPWLNITKEEFLLNCFDPGFFNYMEKVLGFTQREMDYQLKCWLDYVDNIVPSVYEGMDEIILKYKERGAAICVVSHSYSEIIKRDYKERMGIVPDVIFGGDDLPEHRKPSVYPLEQISKRLGFCKEDMVFIDDLKPGLDMAKSYGVDFICAGWSHTLPQIADYMKSGCKYYAESVSDLRRLLIKK